MKLNLACGTDYRDGWINLDIVSKWPVASKSCDVIWDARKDKIPYDNNLATEIYAGYLLMHLAPHYHGLVLSEIKRVLHPDGILIVGEVDMDVVMRRFLDDPTNARLCELIWGEQGNFHGDDLAQYDKHCHGFTESSLCTKLSYFGFSQFERMKIHASEVFYELTIKCKKNA